MGSSRDITKDYVLCRVSGLLPDSRIGARPEKVSVRPVIKSLQTGFFYDDMGYGWKEAEVLEYGTEIEEIIKNIRR